jgi:hypothetical protein
MSVIVLKDGTEVPADDFWLYAPTWFIENAFKNGVIEAIPNGRDEKNATHTPDQGTDP